MSDLQTLASLACGQSAEVAAVHADHGLKCRLQGMGLRAGRVAQVLRRGAFGGPLLVRVGSVDLIMRRIDAADIEILAST